LVQYYRYAKSEIRERSAEKLAADKARERHEYRQFRIEREKQEKAEKLAQREAASKAAAIVAPSTPSVDDTQQIRINEAIERAKAQAAESHPKNTDALTPEQQAEIASIEARRAKIRELATDAGADDEPHKTS
jgi:electron transport complex protein RnfC